MTSVFIRIGHLDREDGVKTQGEGNSLSSISQRERPGRTGPSFVALTSLTRN
jgi:hypothetical protein